MGQIAQVAFPEAEIVQRAHDQGRRNLRLWRDLDRQADTEAAIVNIGYADGYLRCFAGKGRQRRRKGLPLIGRVSMDLVALDASAAPDLRRAIG